MKYLPVCIVYLIVVVTNCNRRPSDGKIGADLIGEWAFSNDTLEFIERVKDNGTFQFRLKIRNMSPFEVEGTWRVDNGAIIRKWKKLSTGRKTERVSVDTVLVINRKMLKVKNKYGNIEEFERRR